MHGPCVIALQYGDKQFVDFIQSSSFATINCRQFVNTLYWLVGEDQELVLLLVNIALNMGKNVVTAKLLASFEPFHHNIVLILSCLKLKILCV